MGANVSLWGPNMEVVSYCKQHKTGLLDGGKQTSDIVETVSKAKVW